MARGSRRENLKVTLVLPMPEMMMSTMASETRRTRDTVDESRMSPEMIVRCLPTRAGERPRAWRRVVSFWGLRATGWGVKGGVGLGGEDRKGREGDEVQVEAE